MDTSTASADGRATPVPATIRTLDRFGCRNRLRRLAVTMWFGVTVSDSSTSGGNANAARDAAAGARAAPPSTTVSAQPAPLPPGYAGTETCVTCHDPEGQSITHSQHGQAKNPRSPAATLGCESCHGPGQAHVDDDAKGTYQEVQGDEAGRSQRDVSHLPQGRHACRLGSAARTTARNLSCITCHSVHTPQSAKRQLKKPTETQVCAHVPPAAGDQDRARRGAHAGARRARWRAAPATTRTARSATSRI